MRWAYKEQKLKLHRKYRGHMLNYFYQIFSTESILSLFRSVTKTLIILNGLRIDKTLVAKYWGLKHRDVKLI